MKSVLRAAVAATAAAVAAAAVIAVAVVVAVAVVAIATGANSRAIFQAADLTDGGFFCFVWCPRFSVFPVLAA